LAIIGRDREVIPEVSFRKRIDIADDDLTVAVPVLLGVGDDVVIPSWRDLAM